MIVSMWAAVHGRVFEDLECRRQRYDAQGAEDWGVGVELEAHWATYQKANSLRSSVVVFVTGSEAFMSVVQP